MKLPVYTVIASILFFMSSAAYSDQDDYQSQYQSQNSGGSYQSQIQTQGSYGSTQGSGSGSTQAEADYNATVDANSNYQSSSTSRGSAIPE